MATRHSAPTVLRLTTAALLGALPVLGAVQAQGTAPTHGPSTPANGGAGDAAAAAGSTDVAAELVAVAAREIARDAVLTATDIAYRPRSAVRPGAAREVPSDLIPAAGDDSLIGWSTRRLLHAGELLRAPAVIPPRAVRSGEQVDVIWSQAGLVVTLVGRATRAAAIGERLTVRIDAHRTLEGIVIAPGRVRVN